MAHTSPPPFPDVSDDQWQSGAQADAVDYDADTDTYRTSFDSDTDSACMAVVSTVAAVSGREPTELPPLYSVVELDALETLIDPPGQVPDRGDVHVSFAFDGYDVTVHSYGIVTVQPRDDTGIDPALERRTD